LREFLEERGQAYVLRVASPFMLTLAAGTRVTCANAVKKLLGDKKRREVRSAGKGSRATGGTPGPGSPPPLPVGTFG
jgi:hypothetical protein